MDGPLIDPVFVRKRAWAAQSRRSRDAPADAPLDLLYDVRDDVAARYMDYFVDSGMGGPNDVCDLVRALWPEGCMISPQRAASELPPYPEGSDALL